MNNCNLFRYLAFENNEVKAVHNCMFGVFFCPFAREKRYCFEVFQLQSEHEKS